MKKLKSSQKLHCLCQDSEGAQKQGYAIPHIYQI